MTRSRLVDWVRREWRRQRNGYELTGERLYRRLHPLARMDAVDFETVRRVVAAVVQREYKDSITTEGRVADPDYFGDRVTAELLGRFPGLAELVLVTIRAEGKRGRRGHEY